MEGQADKGRPKVELISLAVALVTTVEAGCHVHGEGATPPRVRFVQGALSVPLLARSMRRHEACQVQDFLHGDLATKPVEVDSGHGFSSGRGELVGWKEGHADRSVPSHL